MIRADAEKGDGMRTSEVLVMVAAFVVIVAGMKQATVILVPFLLSAFLAVISAAPMFWLRKKGVSNGFSLLIVVTGIVVVITLVAALIGQSVSSFSQDLPVYQQKIKSQTLLFSAWLETVGLDTRTLALERMFDPGAAMKLAAALLNGIGNVLANGFLILMTVIFMLLEAAGLPAKLQAIAGRPDASLAHWEGFVNSVKQYVAIKTWVSLATGVLIWAWLSLLGVDYALLWGFLAFAMNYIPNIGSIIAAVPALLLALVQVGAAKASAAAAGYVVVNVIMGSVIEPRFMGRGLGLSTLIVFLSLLFWGWVLGPVGMLLSVPLTITAKIALESRPDTRWLALLLGPEKALARGGETKKKIETAELQKEPT
jgi:AI-2 transport protein TqsA